MMRRKASIGLTNRVDLRGQPWALAGAAPISPILLQDTFTDINGTLLPAHTPDVAPVGAVYMPWSDDANPPTGDIQGNQARILHPNANVDRAFVIEHRESDALITLTFYGNAVNPAWGGIAFRSAGADPWRVFQASATNAATIETPAGAVAHSLAHVSGINDEILFTLTLNGNNISCVVRNVTQATEVTVFTASAVQVAATLHGLFSTGKWNDGNNDFFDNYLALRL